jgi:hypothetical protein
VFHLLSILYYNRVISSHNALLYPPAEEAVVAIVVVQVHVATVEVQVIGVAAIVRRTGPVVAVRTWIVETAIVVACGRLKSDC